MPQQEQQTQASLSPCVRFPEVSKASSLCTALIPASLVSMSGVRVGLPKVHLQESPSCCHGADVER